MEHRKGGAAGGAIVALIFAIFLPLPAAAAVSPVTDLSVVDKPLDAGRSLRITFGRSIGDSIGRGDVARYELLRRGPKDSAFVSVKTFLANQRGERFAFEDMNVRPNGGYRYFVRALAKDGIHADGAEVGPVIPTRAWFNNVRTNTLIATLCFFGLVLGFIRAARGGANLFIRRIAGLDAIDEAVGRCTEMGKAVLYIPGISTIQDVATIASLNILGQVAKKIASYQSRIIVPNRDPIVYPVTQDVVKLAFTRGRLPAGLS